MLSARHCQPSDRRSTGASLDPRALIRGSSWGRFGSRLPAFCTSFCASFCTAPSDFRKVPHSPLWSRLRRGACADFLLPLPPVRSAGFLSRRLVPVATLLQPPGRLPSPATGTSDSPPPSPPLWWLSLL